MRTRASILAFLILVLFAGNASAAATKFVHRTDFEGWTAPNGAEADALDMYFHNDWAVGTGSVTGRQGKASPTISFEDGGAITGATEFYFNYAYPVTVTITMTESVLNLPFTTIDGYTNFTNTIGSWAVSADGFSITYELTGTPMELSGEMQDPGFGFYAADPFDKHYTIASLTFSSSSAATGDEIVTLTNFQYNPTPIPGAAWLLGSGLIGLVGIRRRFKM